MDARTCSSFSLVLFIAAIIASAYYDSAEAATTKGSFEDNFSIMWSEDHFTTSDDGQIWNLSLDNNTGIKSNFIMDILLHVLYVVVWF